MLNGRPVVIAVITQAEMETLARNATEGQPGEYKFGTGGGARDQKEKKEEKRDRSVEIALANY